MVTDKKFENKLRIDHVSQPDWEDANEAVLKLMNKLVSRLEETFVVITKTTDEVGHILFAEVYVSDTYMGIGNLIASYDYKSLTSVDVYAVQGDEYCMIKHKLYDANCYDSFAGCTVGTYDYRFITRRFWDWNTTIYY